MILTGLTDWQIDHNAGHLENHHSEVSHTRRVARANRFFRGAGEPVAWPHDAHVCEYYGRIWSDALAEVRIKELAKEI